MKGVAQRALVVGLLIAGLLGLLHLFGVGLKLLMLIGAVFAVVSLIAPYIGVRWLDDAIGALRALYWQRDQGHFHSFGGIPLDISDDGHHLWVAAEGLQRVLGRDEADAVVAARHSGRWQRNQDDVLLLRVDAVVGVLNTMPGRTDPRVQRLRRYFEREVLFPASLRKARAASGR
jgi:hypothetical protein